MNFELDVALEQLKSTPRTAQALLSLVKQVSVQAEGSVTVFYGGKLPDGSTNADKAVNAMVDAGADIRVLDKSAAAKFLKDERFLRAVGEAFSLSEADIDKLVFNDYQGPAAEWLYSADAGPWAEASKRFAQETVGEVRLLVGGSSSTRTFNLVELPALLQNGAVTKIEGFDVADLKQLYPEVRGVPPDTSRLFDDLRLTSLRRTVLSGLELGPGPNGQDIVKGQFLDPLLADEAQFRATYKERVQAFDTYLRSHPETRAAFDQLGKFHVESAKSLWESGEAAAKKAAKVYATVGGLLTFAIAASEAAAALAAGRTDDAKRIMAEWVLESAGSAVGEFIGEAVARAVVGVAAAAGVTIAAPLALTFIFGAAFAGSLFGEAAAEEFIHLLNDRDMNGRRDIIDRLSNLLFGATSTITTPLPLDINGGKYTVDAKLSAAEMAANAGRDIAWRFALRELNSFVVTDIGYDQHNTDGSLDLFDPVTREGAMSQEYIVDRAAMLAWKVRYEKTGAMDADDLPRTGPKPYNEDWDTSQVVGNWDYVDLTHRLPGGAPLQLSIDGTGLSLDDHQIVFGSSGNDAIVGEGESDRLYGGSGNDTIEGKGGDDYLEGGAGDDTFNFSGNFGKDVLFDSDGVGRIQIGADVLGQAVATGIRNTWRTKMGDGRFVDLVLRDDAASATGYTLMVQDGSKSISITHFDLSKAQSASGFLGIKLQTGNKVALLAQAQNFWSDPDADIGGLAGSVRGIDEGGGKTFSISLSQAAKSGDTVSIQLAGLGGKGVRFVVNGQEFTGDSITVGLEEGQTQLAFSLNQDGPLDANATGSLKVVFNGQSGTSESNAWTVTLHDAGGSSSQLTGDLMAQTATSAHDHLRQDYNGQAVTVIRQGETVFVKDANGNLIAGGDVLVTDNVIFGTTGNDDIDGGVGDDLLVGGEGNDRVLGGAGSDMIAGGAGNDHILGGDGDDFIASAGVALAGLQQLGETDHWMNWGMPTDATLIAGGATWGVYTRPSSGSAKVWSAIEESVTNVQSDFIDAGAGDDLVAASWGGDRVKGGDGDDQIQGLAGDDLLEGNAGNDIIEGDSGVLTAAGGLFNHSPAHLHGNDNLDGGEGNDVLRGGGGGDHLYGGADDDHLVGDSDAAADDASVVPLEFHGQDLLSGGDGDDYAEGNGGDDTLLGGTGNDVLWGDAAASRMGSLADLPAAWGNDHLNGEAGDDQLVGGGGEDTLLGGIGDDVLVGDEADASLDAAVHGADVLRGEDGNDTLLGGGKDDDLLGGDGDDKLWGDDIQARLNGASHGNDYLEAGAGADELRGDGGNDKLFGGTGNDLLAGDASGAELSGAFHGVDVLHGEAGDDQLVGGGNADQLSGGDGTDVLYGDDMAENLAGEFHGSDSLDGGAGDDHLVGGGGDDFLLGEGDDDLLFGDDLEELAGAFHGADYLDGGAGDDQLVGGGGSDQLVGGDGDDDLVGDDQDLDIAFHGHDTLEGGAGQDRLYAGHGDDYLSGGTGDDLFIVRNTSGYKTIVDDEGYDALDLGWSFDEIELSEDGTLTNTSTGQQVSVAGLSGFDGGAGSVVEAFGLSSGWVSAAELLAGVGMGPGASAGNDIIEGTTGDDAIRAGNGDDEVSGGAGNDDISGDDGWDLLRGGDGHDRLSGGAGGDDLDGGNGSDVVLGGDGGDHLIASSGDDSLDGGTGNDTYEVGEGAGATVIADAEGYDTLRLGWRVDDVVAGLNNTLINATTGQSVRIVGWNPDAEDAGTPIDTFIFQSEEGWDVWLDAMDLAQGVDLEWEGTEHADTFLGSVFRDHLEAGSGNDVLDGRWSDDEIHGGGGDDLIAGGVGDDLLHGDAGNDTLYGGSGADVLAGGAGNNLLAGGEGNDRYRVNLGDGNVLILDASGINTLELGAGLEHSALQLQRPQGSDDLVLSFGTGPTVHISGGVHSSIARVAFADGTLLDYQDLMGLLPEALVIVDDDAAHDLTGAGGNDTLIGNHGDDRLFGNAGNDVLDAGAGDDLLVGGRGDDRLLGGEGKDIYRLTRGSGHDRIEDATGDLEIRMGPGIEVGDLHCERVVADGKDWLRLSYGDTDSVMILDGATLPGLRLLLDSGIDLAPEELFAVALNESVTVAGTDEDDVLYGQAGSDTLLGGAGRDVLRGGRGIDTYEMQPGGIDLVQDVDGGVNVIRTAVATGAELQYVRRGSDLILMEAQGASAIRIESFFGGTAQWQLEVAGGQRTDLRTEVAGSAAREAIAGRKDAFFAKIGRLPTSELTQDLWGPSPLLWSTPGGDETLVHYSVARQVVSAQGGPVVAESSATTIYQGSEVIREEEYTVERTIEEVTREIETTPLPDRVRVLGTVNGTSFTPVGSNVSWDIFSWGSIEIPSGVTVLPDGNLVTVESGGVNTVVHETRTVTTVIETHVQAYYRDTYDVSHTVVDVHGDGADNSILLNGSSVLVSAEGGNDRIERSDTSSSGLLGDPSVVGDFVDAGSGNDVVLLGSGDDEIAGGAGNDYLDGGAGGDTYFIDAADTGWDTIVDQAIQRVPVTLYVAYGGVAFAPYLSAFEELTGGADSFDLQGHYLRAHGSFVPTLANLELVKQLNAQIARQVLASKEEREDGPNELPFEGSLGNAAYAAVDRLVREDGVLAHDDDVFGALGGSIDVVRFGAGIDRADLAFAATTIDLEDGTTAAGVSISWGTGAGLRVAVDPALASVGYGIERFEFADGTYLTRAELLDVAGLDQGPASQVQALVQAMAAFSPPPSAETGFFGGNHAAAQTLLAPNVQAMG